MKLDLTLSAKKLIRLVTTTVVILLLSGGLALCSFLYRHMYQPLTQAIIVVELRSQVSTVSVEAAAFRELLTAIDQSHRPLTIQESLRDPFTQTSAPTAPLINMAPSL